MQRFICFSLAPIFMRACIDCDITFKVQYCCGSDPDTKKSVDLVLADGLVVSACPSLNRDGGCNQYGSRPDPCKEYIDCPNLEGVDLFDILYA